MLGYFSILPFLVIGNVLVVVVVLIWAWRLGPRNRDTAKTLRWMVLAPTALLWLSILLFTGVKREMAFDMKWSYGPPPSWLDGDHHVRLDFVDYPGHYVGIYSKDLGDYLESLPSREVRVVFEVTMDFGSTRGFHEVRIGERTSWHRSGGYAGVTSPAGPSPWR